MLLIDKRMKAIERMVGADNIEVAFVSEGSYWKGIHGPAVALEIFDPSGTAVLRFSGSNADDALQDAWNHFCWL